MSFIGLDLFSISSVFAVSFPTKRFQKRIIPFQNYTQGSLAICGSQVPDNFVNRDHQTVKLGLFQVKTIIFPLLFAVLPCFLIREQSKTANSKSANNKRLLYFFAFRVHSNNTLGEGEGVRDSVTKYRKGKGGWQPKGNATFFEKK